MTTLALCATINVPRRRRRRRAHINVASGMKWCPHCTEFRSTESFGIASDRTDGLSGWCRSCRAANEKQRRDAGLGEGRQGCRERYARAPHQWHAKVAVERAVKGGRLVKPDACSKCDRIRKVEAHHHVGYDRMNWLNVSWVCRQCHAIAHRSGGAIAGNANAASEQLAAAQ